LNHLADIGEIHGLISVRPFSMLQCNCSAAGVLEEEERP
jgi:hypothetical protein